MQPPPLWGSEEHVRELFGDRVGDWRVERRTLPVTCFATPEAFCDYRKTYYGPTIAAYAGPREDRQRIAALDRDLAELGRRFDLGTGPSRFEWEYLLVVVTRAQGEGVEKAG